MLPGHLVFVHICHRKIAIDAWNRMRKGERLPFTSETAIPCPNKPSWFQRQKNLLALSTPTQGQRPPGS